MPPPPQKQPPPPLRSDDAGARVGDGARAFSF